MAFGAAKTALTSLAKKLLPLQAGYPILTLEPSCHTALVDDMPDLLDDEVVAAKLKSAILPMEEFW